MVCFESPLSIFSFLTSFSLSFHPFCSLSVYPSLPFVPTPPPFSVLLMDKLTMAPPLGLASGPSRTNNMPGILCTVLHTFTWRQGNSNDLHTKHFSFYYVLLLSYSLVLSLDYLFFVIVMKLSHNLPLTLSAGYKGNLLSRTIVPWIYKYSKSEQVTRVKIIATVPGEEIQLQLEKQIYIYTIFIQIVKSLNILEKPSKQW